MIHDYRHKPPPIIFLEDDDTAGLSDKDINILKKRIAHFTQELPVKPTPIVFGMELEIELVKGSERADAEDLSYNWDDTASSLALYFKRDSSLQNGFEIVSHPRSIGSWNSIRNKMKDLMKSMRDKGFRSYDTGRCGMHFHINRSAFSGSIHIAKFIKFWQDNHELSFALSRRTTQSMAKYSHFHLDKSEPISALLAEPWMYLGRTRSRGGLGRVMEHYRNQLPHHSAIALTANTVEIRIFRGTMNVNTILTTMEMVAKVVNVTRDCSIADLGVATILSRIPNNKKNKKIRKMLSMRKEVEIKSLCQPKYRAGFREGSVYEDERRNFQERLTRLIQFDTSKEKPIVKWIKLANEEEMKRVKYASEARAGTDKKKKPTPTMTVEALDTLLQVGAFEFVQEPITNTTRRVGPIATEWLGLGNPPATPTPARRRAAEQEVANQRIAREQQRRRIRMFINPTIMDRPEEDQ